MLSFWINLKSTDEAQLTQAHVPNSSQLIKDSRDICTISLPLAQNVA